MVDDLVNHVQDEGVPGRWPRNLARLCDVIYSGLDIIPNEVDRWDQTMRLVVRIAQDMGGREVYLPRGEVLRIALRDGQAFRLAERGWSCERIAEHLRLTDRQVRTIIARETALRVARAQGDLFGSTESLPGKAA